MKLVAEAVRSAISQPVASTVTALVIAGVCAAILATTGQTVRAEQNVLARIDEAGTRSIIITDTDGTAGIDSTAVDRIRRLSGVEWAIGLGPASDVSTAANPEGNPAAIRTLHGPTPPQVDTNTELASGHAIAGPTAQETLGLLHPYGGVTGETQYAVVGGFTATEPLTFLNRGLLTRGPEPGILRSIHVLTVDPTHVEPVARAALRVLAAEELAAISVETSATLADVRAAVQGELGQYSRQLITLVLAAGLVLTGLAVYGAVTSRRRDFGRRRALGASRPLIISLVATQTVAAALVGALTGTVATFLTLHMTTGTVPNPSFATAINILAILAAVLAALPPAIAAAFRDPVRVLRVP